MLPFFYMRFFRNGNLTILQPFIDKMEKGELTLENILEEDEIVQDLKTNPNSKFIGMLTNKAIRQLIDYATKIPKSDDKNVGYKYPFNATEILCCENKSVIERIMTEKKKGEPSDEEEDEKDEKEEGEKEKRGGYNVDDEKNDEENEEFIEDKEEEEENKEQIQEKQQERSTEAERVWQRQGRHSESRLWGKTGYGRNSDRIAESFPKRLKNFWRLRIILYLCNPFWKGKFENAADIAQLARARDL